MTPSGFTVPDMLPASAEIFLLSMACVVLLVDVWLPQRYRRLTYQLSQASLAGAALLVLAMFPEARVTTFDGTFVADQMAAVLKMFLLVVSGFGFFYSRVHLEPRGSMRGEYFVLGLFAVLGMMVLVSAGSFLTLYLGLELLSLSLYAMVALDRDSSLGCEAAMKYFVLGALASGILLYGISMIYGSTGNLDLSRVAESIAAPGAMRLTMVLGLVFVVVGVAFKLGAVPFHMWVPDVYEGAPTPVTLFIATAPKIAAFGMLMRALVDGLRRAGRRLVPDAHGARGIVDGGRKRHRYRADEHQTHARLFGDRARRIHLRRHGVRHFDRILGIDVLRPDLCADGARWIRDGDLARAGRHGSGSARRLQGLERAQSVVRVHDADPDVVHGRSATVRRLLGEVVGVAGK